MSESARARLTISDLESHERFVRAMVRQLVRDEASLDDVIQETWIRALSAPPRNFGALRAWLTRIARRVALNTHRSETRRTAREQAVARNEAVDTRAQAHRDAIRHLLVRAVLRLPEPYRSTVIDRYYHGRSAALIGARAGITAGAVRKRLRHANALLRTDVRAVLRSGPLIAVVFRPDHSLPARSMFCRLRLWFDSSVQWFASFTVHAIAAGLILLLPARHASTPEPSSVLWLARAAPEEIPIETESRLALADAPWPASPAPDASKVLIPAPVAAEEQEQDPTSDPAPEPVPRADAVGLAGLREMRGVGGPGGRLRFVRSTRDVALVSPVVARGLDWLVRHQDPNGRWDSDRFMKHDPPDSKGQWGSGAGACWHDEGCTALAVHAFLAAGYNGQGPRSGPDGARRRAVLRGLRFLMRRQRDDGAVGFAAHRFLYHHALATAVLCEAYVRTRSPAYGGAARRALRFLLDARSRDGAWRYQPRALSGDMSVTAWCVFALDSARRAGLKTSPSVHLALRSWTLTLTDAGGHVGYRRPGGGSARPEGRIVEGAGWRAPTLTAAGVVVRRLLGEPKDAERLADGIDLCLQTLPSARSGAVNHLYWLFGTRALKGCGGAAWTKWRAAMRQALVTTQRCAAGPDRGSWDPIGPWGHAGGRVYSTAVALLTLSHVGPPGPTRTDGDVLESQVPGAIASASGGR